MRGWITTAIVSLFLSSFCSSLAAQTAPSINLYSLEGKGVPTGTVHAYKVNSSSGVLTEVPGSPFNAGLSPIQLVVDPTGRFVYVANLESDDITAFSVDASTGTLTPLPGSPFPIGTQASGQQAVALAIDPTGRFLYVSADNVTVDAPANNLYEYTIDSLTGFLTAAASSSTAQGILVTWISFDPGGNYAYIGQGGTSGSNLPILVYAVDFSSGLLTSVGEIQVASGQGYGTIVDPSGQFLYSFDPIEKDEIDAFTISSGNGLATEISGSPYAVGPVPLDMGINPSGSFLYVVNTNSPYQTTAIPSEYEGSISAFTIDSETGALSAVSGSPFAAGINPISVVVDPTGKFAYVSSTTYTTGYDGYAQILGYSVNTSSGILTPFSGTSWTDSAEFSGGGRLAISYAPSTTPNPVPVISSLLPSSATAGSAGFTLQVNGANFVPGARVYFGGQGRNTTLVNSTQLNVDVLSSDISNGGTAVVFVFNPLPGGGASPSVEFTVLNPSPTISSINPSSVAAAGTGFTLTVNGSGFVTGSSANFNGAGLATTYVSSTQLTAAISGSANAIEGTDTITVTNAANGAAGGGTSNPVTLTILPPNVQPTVSSLSPASATAGGPGFTLTVNGSGFVQGTQISFNLNNVSTTLVSASQLTASISASAIAIAGNPYVIVTNPNGFESVQATFTVSNPQPTGGSVSPPSLPAGSNALTLNISGTGFAQGSVVLVNGNPRATSFISSILLQATLLPSDLAQGGTLNITVMNPPPGGTTTVISFAVADYAVSSPSSSLTVTAGQTGIFTLTAAPSNGSFSNPVTFSVSGLPTGATASFSPSATITPGSTPTNLTLSIATTAHSEAALPVNPFRRVPSLPSSVAWLVVFGVILGIRIRFIRARATCLASQFLLASLLLMTSGLTACGGTEGTSSGQQLNPATGTPAGTYTIAVTATSGTVMHSTNITLTVL